MKIALISCTKLKREYACKAKDLYSPSAYFSAAYKYASQVADKTYILSAKHGLLEEDVFIEPYNETLNEKSYSQKQEWGHRVISKLKDMQDLENDEFIILTGKNYYEQIISHIKHVNLPLLNLPLGEKISKLQKLTAVTENDGMCERLHMKFNSMPLYTYSDIDKIPFESGIYIMFEEGEIYKGYKRITRVGTHRSDGRLKRRLKDHFLVKNKNGSIFRKNIGRASLNKYHDPYLRIWNMDTRVGGPHEHLAQMVDIDKEQELEEKISNYLQKFVTFTCFQVDTNEERLRLEEAIIATLNQEPSFGPSNEWKGLYSPIEGIRLSGLWLLQGLDGVPLTDIELERVLNADNRIEPIKVKSTIKNHIYEHRDNKKSIKQEVVDYIMQLKETAKNKGLQFVDLVSGDIHRNLGYSNRMPTVCNAMYSMKKPGDKILHSTPSGKSSTIKIRYYI